MKESGEHIAHLISHSERRQKIADELVNAIIVEERDTGDFRVIVCVSCRILQQLYKLAK